MLLSGIGISMFTYVQAYPKANLVVVPQYEIRVLQVSTWLIVSGLIIMFVFGGASQVTSCVKRRSKAAAAANAARRRKDTSIGTGLDESTTVPTDNDGMHYQQRGGDVEQGGGRVFEEEQVPLLGGVDVPKFSNGSLKINFAA
jgi:hypothetical protein